MPHQLHMPSHVYVDLGMWRAAVRSNVASLDAAWGEGGRTHDWYHGSFFLQARARVHSLPPGANAVHAPVHACPRVL